MVGAPFYRVLRAWRAQNLMTLGLLVLCSVGTVFYAGQLCDQKSASQRA